MNLDEAIKHCEEVAESKEKQIKNGDWEKDSLTERNCIKCASEHRQLAEWLRDYKQLKEQQSSVSENPNKCDLISREAVEEIINDIRDCISVEGYWAILERLKKLPSVKPQESCDVPDTNDGDIISKQTVLDTISELNAISFYEAQEDSRETYYEIRQAIKDLSPVKQEPKTGHWIDTGSGQECSECHEIQYGYDNHRFYCGNCGARMEVENNG